MVYASLICVTCLFSPFSFWHGQSFSENLPSTETTLDNHSKLFSTSDIVLNHSSYMKLNLEKSVAIKFYSFSITKWKLPENRDHIICLSMAIIADNLLHSVWKYFTVRDNIIFT